MEEQEKPISLMDMISKVPLQTRMEVIFMSQVFTNRKALSKSVGLPLRMIDKILMFKDRLLKDWKYNPNPNVPLRLPELEVVAALHEMLLEWNLRRLHSGRAVNEFDVLRQADYYKQLFQAPEFETSGYFLYKYSVNFKSKEWNSVANCSLDTRQILKDLSPIIPEKICTRFLQCLRKRKEESFVLGQASEEFVSSLSAESPDESPANDDPLDIKDQTMVQNIKNEAGYSFDKEEFIANEPEVSLKIKEEFMPAGISEYADLDLKKESFECTEFAMAEAPAVVKTQDSNSNSEDKDGESETIEIFQVVDTDSEEEEEKDEEAVEEVTEGSEAEDLDTGDEEPQDAKPQEATDEEVKDEEAEDEEVKDEEAEDENDSGNGEAEVHSVASSAPQVQVISDSSSNSCESSKKDVGKPSSDESSPTMNPFFDKAQFFRHYSEFLMEFYKAHVQRPSVAGVKRKSDADPLSGSPQKIDRNIFESSDVAVTKGGEGVDTAMDSRKPLENYPNLTEILRMAKGLEHFLNPFVSPPNTETEPKPTGDCQRKRSQDSQDDEVKVETDDKAKSSDSNEDGAQGSDDDCEELLDIFEVIDEGDKGPDQDDDVVNILSMDEILKAYYTSNKKGEAGCVKVDLISDDESEADASAVEVKIDHSPPCELPSAEDPPVVLASNGDAVEYLQKLKRFASRVENGRAISLVSQLQHLLSTEEEGAGQ